MLTWLGADLSFPPLERALHDPNGLLAAGGDLSPERLQAAYRHGCYPWYNPGQPILWWSPAPRFVLDPAHPHIPRSLAKLLRTTPWQITYDRAFAKVIQACAAPRPGADGTWITAEMQAAYIRLHHLGLAHSVEVWDGEALIGGLYGVTQGRMFFGESMFSRASNASKVGFASLLQHLYDWGYRLIDCQMQTAHLARFGATPLPRTQFKQALEHWCEQTPERVWGLAECP